MSADLPPSSWFKDRISYRRKPRALIEPKRVKGCPACGGPVMLGSDGPVCMRRCVQ